MGKYSVAKSKLGAPKLESLSPIDESFFQNLKQSHLQITVWRYSLNSDPPTVGICFYGCGKNGETKYFIPLPVAPDVFLPPQEIMKVFRYSCNSENSFKSGTAPVTCLAQLHDQLHESV